MGQLESGFTVEDLSLMFEAVEEWERNGTMLMSIIEQIENAPPLPDEVPDEVKQHVQKLKDYYLGKKKDAVKQTELRKERATLVKAKLILQKQDAAIAKL